MTPARTVRGENVGRSRFVISLAVKNLRIVLAPRVSAVTRLGEFRVRHEMSSFCTVYGWEREREKERIHSWKGMVSGRRILDHRKSRTAVAIPAVCPFPPRFSCFFFLPLYFSHSWRGKGEGLSVLCAPSHFPSKLLLTLDVADNSPLGYTLRPITALFTRKLSHPFTFLKLLTETSRYLYILLSYICNFTCYFLLHLFIH